ncbi:MAG: bifunctional methylenetetrahydrofolate dehydrogenase/methenyltetrahydrofolate cyclohydrolase FolD [Clostridia bacterium]|nr:bifunctional methylenetetrahydrofolate dehydrogenase/methenyltetrahydrofolate cyclohydrolase FolD [Clostridia bacterium]
MAELINGKVVSRHLRELIASDVLKFKEEYGITPGLAVILVGDDPASTVYVKNKHKACLEVGINSIEIHLPATVAEDVLISKIEELNTDAGVNGILVQLPLPKHICEERVINSIIPEKDVDAFHPINVGKLMLGKPDFIPCTPAGIMELLNYYSVEISGKECVVIGRSNIVGKPIAQLLLSKNGTVTVCHSRTKNLTESAKRADILVVAIGKPDFVNGDMIKPGAVVIDVGINRKEDGKLTGDVDFESVTEKAAYVTPVPGGVGPMTITMLLKNTLIAAKKQISKYFF